MRMFWVAFDTSLLVALPALVLTEISDVDKVHL